MNNAGIDQPPDPAGAKDGISAIENLYSGTGALAGMYGSMHRGPASYVGVLSS